MSRTPRDRARLHRIAETLKPVELPYYVGAPQEPGQLAGWYWIPPGATAPVPLGSNAHMAHAALLTYLARHGVAAA